MESESIALPDAGGISPCKIEAPSIRSGKSDYDSPDSLLPPPADRPPVGSVAANANDPSRATVRGNAPWRQRCVPCGLGYCLRTVTRLYRGHVPNNSHRRQKCAAEMSRTMEQGDAHRNLTRRKLLEVLTDKITIPPLAATKAIGDLHKNTKEFV